MIGPVGDGAEDVDVRGVVDVAVVAMVLAIKPVLVKVVAATEETSDMTDDDDDDDDTRVELNW